MSFAISTVSNVPTVTQTGTDTSWTGIDTMITAVAAVAMATAYVAGDIRKPPAQNGAWYRCTTAGTTAGVAPLYNPVSGSTTTDGTAVFTAFVAPFSTVAGDQKLYWLGLDIDMVVNGTLTIADPMQQTVTCRTFWTGSAAIYTSGVFCVDGVTPKTAGVHFITLKAGPNNFADQSNWDGVWSIRGGAIVLAASIRTQGTGSIRFFGVTFSSGKSWGGQSIRWRSFATNIQLINCFTYDVGIDAFNIPSQVSVKGFGSEYVSQYVGSSFGGTDALMTISALSNQDGTYDFDNYGAGWVEIYNCAKAAALVIVCQNNSANHCTPLFQNLNFTITNLQGVVQNGVRFTCTDAPTNSPATTLVTRGALKTWDFRNPLTYTGITAGGGLASSVPCLKVWHGGASTQNLRFPASTATYRFCGYSVMQQDSPIVLGSDLPQAPRIAMTAATNLILSEAVAAALTNIGLVASGAAGGTATLTATRTLSELWQYFRAWKPLNLASDDLWLFDGTVLTIGGWTVAATLTTGGAYTYLGGTIEVSLVVPAFTGGTLNIGAAATYGFSTVSAIVSMTPINTNPYTFGGTHGGTLTLRNATAFAITVQVPRGTVTSTAGNTGGAITVVFANTVITVSGIIAGSQILYRRTDTQAVLRNAAVVGTTDSYSYQWTTDLPVEVIIRKGTAAPFYQPSRSLVTLGVNDSSLTVAQISDT